METDRTLVATAVVKTDSAGDWPSVANGDTYFGFLRFDEVSSVKLLAEYVIRCLK